MVLRVVGAGLPRTGTSSLREALQQLLGAPCCHMSAIPGHPFDLGQGWASALADGGASLDTLLADYAAAVDWPASLFWRELSTANPDALVLLSTRDCATTWWASFAATILPVARLALAPGWQAGRALLDLLDRFSGNGRWDDPTTMMTAYDRHNAEVRTAVPPSRLLDWRATDG